MLDIVLHAGTEHVNLWIVLLPALAAFICGIALGWRSRTQGDSEAAAIDGPANGAVDGAAYESANGAVDGTAYESANGVVDGTAYGPANGVAYGPDDRAVNGPVDRAADGSVDASDDSQTQ